MAEIFSQKINAISKKAFTKISDIITEPNYAKLWHSSEIFRRFFQKSEQYLLSKLRAAEERPDNVCLLQRPLYFLHIPKTAGSSLKYWLADLIAPEDVLELYTLASLENALPDQIDRYQHYTGHLGFALYDFLKDRSLVETFTWLRNPTKREVSQYNFIRQTREGQLSMFLSPELKNYVEAASQLSIAELCYSDAYQGYYDNLQTRMLAGLVPPQANGRDLTQADLDGHGTVPSLERSNAVTLSQEATQEQHWKKSLLSLRICQRQMIDGSDALDSAKQNLLALPHFGICEWMQPSIDLFCYRFGLLPKIFNLRLNQSERTSDKISDHDLALVRQNNAIDSELYDFAVNEFLCRIAAMWQDCLGYSGLVEQRLFTFPLGKQLREITTDTDVKKLLESWHMPEIQALISHFLMENFQRCRSTDRRYSRFLLSFSKAAFWVGWQPREYSDTLKTWVRWADPSPNAMMLLPLQTGQDYRVIFKVFHYASLEVLRSLKLFVAGEELFLQRIAITEGEDDGAYLFTGFIPARLIVESKPYTQLTFRTEQADCIKVLSRSTMSPSYTSFALDSLLAEGVG